MTLLQLEYFRVMSRTLHYSEAARELHTTQPNLSYAMKELEKELGAPLFEKQGRRVRLSAFGMQFACYADKALRTLAEGQEVLRQMKTLPEPLSIAYIDELGYDFLPELLRSFHDTFPLVPLQLYRYLHPDILPRLLNHSMNFAFTIYEPDTPSLEQLPVTSQDMMLFVPPNHRLSGRSSVSLTEIGMDPVAVTQPHTAIRRIIDEMCETAGIRLNVVFEAEECNAAALYVSSGLALSILPFSPLCTMYRAEAIRIAFPSRTRQICLSYDRDQPLTPSALQFLNYVRKNLVKPPEM
ncbi:MAG: LysR family transcriptional regulator [Lachnospiraceae bacterium]|uniref:LysR family transcriptional regulator n=1 Tax=Hominifimenecus microfluidus TaxID=2885348 RepID=A0AAE3E9C2_9FIRM|nr:LysR family transcriptional regulator [Hominifimenecus microfluidus]MCC2230337.1 LysR family transcriptional regulator [Hominifimenecus microfluidus]